MRKFCWIITALLFMAIGVPRAHADTMFNVSATVFNATGGALGTCASGARCSFSGTLTIDTTLGTLTAIDITFPGLSAFTSIFEDYQDGAGWEVVSLSSGYQMNLIFGTSPTAGSLLGFTGTDEVSANVDYPQTNANIYFAGGGTITPVATPEPGTLVLLLFGLVALVLVRKRMARGLQPVT